MNKYKIIRINYPGVFSLKPNIWFKFSNSKENFAFYIAGVKKGLTIHDPDNFIIQNQGFQLRKKVDEINKENYCLKPIAFNRDLDFFSITEPNPKTGRNFYDTPYTELFLLIEKSEEKTTLDKVKYYLNHLFIRYNSNSIHSTVLLPNDSYWQESMVILESNLQSSKNFEEFINAGINLNLNFIIAEIYLGQSKYGVLPLKSSFINTDQDLKQIPEEYFDVFELYSLGLMQLNHYKNFKLALLECFVAVEVLVVRVTDEQKKIRGVSKTKISEFKQAIDIAHRMDVELKLFFDFDKNEEAIIGQMVRARKIRNNIMHENQQVDQTEIIEIIKNINQFIFMLAEKNIKKRQ
ncbi:MAG: hypothetical protein WA143_13165 [Lutibacter sp.]